MGHEAIGVVEDVGADVRTIKRGDLVVMPFAFSDGTCEFCHEGLHTACVHGGFFGNDGINGAQAEALRVPLRRRHAVPAAGRRGRRADAVAADALRRDGHRPPRRRRRRGRARARRVAVVGDGAVGLCGVIAAKRLGAEQIIILGRHADRIALAREFGATDVVSERGEEAVERVRELTGGHGAHSVLECVGTAQSMATAIEHRAPGRRASAASACPHYDAIPARSRRSSRTSPSAAAPRRCAPTSRSCCPTSSRAASSPGRVFDRTVGLDGVPDGYRAMDDRESIKVMVRP